MKKYKLQTSGFSLVEVIVSVALFSVIILSMTQIFKMVIDSQRSALATQNVQESLKYFLEVIGKEIRMAQKNEGVCSGIPDDEIYVISSNAYGGTLYFKNYYNQCVTYSLDQDGTGDRQRFRVSRGSVSDFISPAKIRIEGLSFINASLASTTQPAITLNIKAYALGQGEFKSEMDIQTTMTSRYYK
ncbi:MAG: prepilin-type N-terminal cleavage/methylation domain-containing protein [Patescibacteria group bacterium]|jgi:prepilin-type N-terminal cleavage/methylation domain-containing protein